VNCPKCFQNTTYMEGPILRCLCCGYWNDTLRPLHTKKEQKKLDALDKERLLAEVAKILEKDREKDREYKRNWARDNAERINADRRKRQAKLTGEVRAE
jgi:UDP-N-acetylglucosamine 2-epimerase